MNIRSMMLRAAASGCALGMVWPSLASAAVSEEDFKALSDLVQKQGQILEELQKTHDQDLQQIQKLQLQLGQTQQLATNAVSRAAIAESKAESATIPTPPGMAATHDFDVTGDAEVQFGQTSGQHPTFMMADFAPIFLFRAKENILFEAGFDVTLQNNVDSNGNPTGGSSTAVDLSFAQLDYMLNDYVTLIAGDMLLPLGTYSERAAGWLNKIPDDPLVIDALPGSGIGAQLRGAVPVGETGQSFTYAVYCANGPSSSDHTNNFAADLDLGGNVGDSPNWHNNPSVGSRLGWFYPWKAHYDLELGVSGQTGQWTDQGHEYWSAGVLDAALHLGAFIEVKGEYVYTWYGTGDMGIVQPRGLYVQAGYKLAGLKQNLGFLNDVELVGRFDNYNDGQGTKTDRYTLGYVYYLSNTLLFEGDYEWMCSSGPNALPSRLFVLQLSYGF